MPETVSDFLVRRLKAWGVQRLYGYSGDGINGILGALDRAGNDPVFIQVRHEENASLMACAHAKFTGTVGVCLATQGPGAIHLLNGLYDARLDHQPVVAIVGDITQMSGGEPLSTGSRFADALQRRRRRLPRGGERSGASPSCHRSGHANRPRRANGDLRHHPAQRANAGGGADPTPRAWRDALGDRLCAAAHRSAGRRICSRAAEVLNAGQRVAILIGAGALGRRRQKSSKPLRSSVRAWPRPSSAKPRCRTTCRS